MPRKVSRDKVTREARKVQTTEVAPPEQMAEVSQKDAGKDITFKCKFCGMEKPLGEMRVLTKYFPPVVLCKDCEKGE